MAKAGMKRPEVTHTQPRNDAAAVPELQGNAKTGKKHARPIVAGTGAPNQKVYHSRPHDPYPAIDNDLARDNLENDLTAADRQDL